MGEGDDLILRPQEAAAHGVQFIFGDSKLRKETAHMINSEKYTPRVV